MALELTADALQVLDAIYVISSGIKALKNIWAAVKTCEAMEITTYLWGCIFYMLGSICFVIGTGFYLADGIRLAQAK